MEPFLGDAVRPQHYARHSLFQAGYEEWEMTEARFFKSDEQTCLDLTLRHAGSQRRLRFLGCTRVKFQLDTAQSLGAFPYLFDVSGDGLEGLSVLVADEDATSANCQLYLWARRVVELEALPTTP